MVDDVGLVNMNGRIYDPEIGRFMSADPIVQDPTDTQSLNRYSYVGNNPLSYTDPTGYFSLGKLLRTIIAIVIVVVAAIYGQGWVAGALYGSGTAAATACTTVCGAIAGAIGGAIAGGITSGGDLRSIAVGAISGAAFAGLGTAKLDGFAKVAAYGTTGGVTSVAQGGNFQSGFLAAGFSAYASPYIDQVANDNIIVGATASAAIGGTASVLGGGKFANGAVTGAFSYAVGRALKPSDSISSVGKEDSDARPAGVNPDPEGGDVLLADYKTISVPERFLEGIRNVFRTASLTGSALKTDAWHALANDLRVQSIDEGTYFLTPSRDVPGVSLLLQHQVTVPGYGAGIVEYLYSLGSFAITHQIFLPGAPISGFPNNFHGKRYPPFGTI